MTSIRQRGVSLFTRIRHEFPSKMTSKLLDSTCISCFLYICLCGEDTQSPRITCRVLIFLDAWKNWNEKKKKKTLHFYSFVFSFFICIHLIRQLTCKWAYSYKRFGIRERLGVMGHRSCWAGLGVWTIVSIVRILLAAQSSIDGMTVIWNAFTTAQPRRLDDGTPSPTCLIPPHWIF